MQRLMTALEVSASALWTGASAGFAFVSAPLAFRVVSDRDQFATLTGRSLARLARALWLAWLVTGEWSEGREWLRRGIASSASDAMRAELLAAAGALAQNQGDYADAVTCTRSAARVKCRLSTRVTK